MKMLFGIRSSGSKQADAAKMARLDWVLVVANATGEFCTFCDQPIADGTFLRAESKPHRTAHCDCVFKARQTLRGCGIRPRRLWADVEVGEAAWIAAQGKL